MTKTLRDRVYDALLNHSTLEDRFEAVMFEIDNSLADDGPEYDERELTCPECGQKNVTLTATVPQVALCQTDGCRNRGDPYLFLDEPDEQPADEPSDVDQNDPTDGSVMGPDD